MSRKFCGPGPAPQRPAPAAPRLLYLVPDFANPDGTTMSRAARQRALDQARASMPSSSRTPPIPPCATTARTCRRSPRSTPRTDGIEASRTLYCGTFSKTLSPGLRVGWVCGPTTLIRKLTLLKQGADLHTATLNQIVHASGRHRRL